MSKRYITASWKMNLSVEDSLSYAEKLAEYGKKHLLRQENVEVFICPDFLTLYPISHIFKDTGFKLGAQDCFWEDKGSYTGEISPLYLKQIGCEYVFVGHLERMTYVKEDPDMVHKKINACLRNDLTPVLFVVEMEKYEDENKAHQAMRDKLFEYIAGIETEDVIKIIIVYEPAWAVGKMQAAPVEYTHRMLHYLRKSLEEKFGSGIGARQLFMYGGGVSLEGAREIMGLDNINGIGMGTASLKYDFFTGAIEIAKELGR
jgi:triosephosphate isomerase